MKTKSKQKPKKKWNFHFRFPDIKGKTWENNAWLFAMHVVLITLLALGLSRFLLNDLSGISAFSPVEKVADYSMSDMYNAVANRRAVRQLNNDIIIVATDGCSRADIAQLVREIDAYQPAAIGLDIFFPYQTSDDSLLLSSFSACDKLILPMQVADTAYMTNNYSFFDGYIDAPYGCVNLELADIRSTVRTFRPYYAVNGETIPNFAVALIQQAKSEVLPQLEARDQETEIIFFPSVEFDGISGRDVLESDTLLNGISHKIVLLGDMKNMSDSYLTPLDVAVPGVLIHAYTAYTILSNRFISVSADWLNWLIAIVICIIYTIVNVYAKKLYSNMGNFMMRLLQFATMYILFVIGCLEFAYHGSYIDFTPSILMIGLGALAFDLWYGIYACYLKIKEWLTQIPRKK